MAEVMKQWKEEEEEAEVEEVGLVRQQAHMLVTTIATSSIDIKATEKTNESSGLNGGQEIYQTEVNSGDIEKNITLHPSDPIISVDSTSLGNVRTESERVGIITDNLQLVKELYLESLYQKTPTQGFYCPNCKACIQKVLLLDTVGEKTSVPAQPPPPPSERFRCPTCFSFLISIGSLLFPCLGPGNDVPIIRGSSKTWDILKSIVYGGLVESIASLSVVASSASADAATLSIIALSLANLIGGLFILVHHIWDLKAEEPSTNEVVDRYYLSLGKRENFYLHLCIAILSFIIFGVVPPLAYGLTFYEVNNKNVALAAVAGAAVICITLLAITKTYIQRPNTYLPYLKTVLYYLSTGALTSVISYLAGVLIRELLEKLGIGSESSSGFTLMLPEMSVIEKPRFGSY
ncbi:membrane protein of ER body-like protein isoform X1 [Prosopis cineraria]|uniref:membrane protein of ER body-like protein isoform X1 n=1 Tax=Prosopis cineraria TaxID=364024 RepID=UPI00241066DC|nr:membrane protein of ER body-like protein isoform X1 [Prosopis cineraria]